jgi:hypothetical protein
MALLSNAARTTLWAEWQTLNRDACTITKPVLRQCVDNLDQWISDNAASVVAALPASARPANGGLTPAQIALLLRHVLATRFSEGV